MRIAFLTYEFPSLSETFILNQLTGLLDRGNEVVIFAARRGNLHTMHPAVEQHDLLSRVRFQPAAGRGRMVRGVGGACSLLARIPRHPRIVWRGVRTSARGPASLSVGLLPALVPFLDIPPFDVLHAHFGPTGVQAVLLREVLEWRCPLVTSFYGYDLSRTIKHLGPNVYEGLFRTGQRMLCLSEDFRRRLCALGCPPAKVVLHHLGVDCRRFAFAPRRLDPGGTARLISVARLVEKKGIAYAIRAVADLHRRSRRMEYHVVGDGPLRGELQQLAADVGVDSVVRFHGPLPQDRVAELLASSHILLAPSVTAADGDEEGTPVSLMEAMATGLPVVSAFHSGIPEIVCDGESGFLVPEADAAALADRLDKLLADPGQWESMGRAGREWIETHFNIDTLNDRLVNIYRSLTEDEPREALPICV